MNIRKDGGYIGAKIQKKKKIDISLLVREGRVLDRKGRGWLLVCEI